MWNSTLPLEEIDDFAEASAELLLSTRIKFMPLEAQSFATARPTPEAAPVMSAVAPDLKTAVGELMLIC